MLEIEKLPDILNELWEPTPDRHPGFEDCQIRIGPYLGQVVSRMAHGRTFYTVIVRGPAALGSGPAGELYCNDFLEARREAIQKIGDATLRAEAILKLIEKDLERSQEPTRG